MTVSESTWIAIMGLTERGFTGHQHVDRLDLIHMNGRTYDPKLGRFMQADIVVQSPFDTQSYNRYSYLMNNPLNGTDPSGYFSLRDLKEYAGVIIGGALLAWHPLGYGIWQSAVYGAIAGGSSAAVNGGNVLQGAAIGAFSAAAFAGLDGAGFGWGAAGDVGQHTLNIAASGVLGGTITVLQEGKFGHGFASAGFTAAAGGGIRAGIRTPGGRIVASAIAGGTVSEISGGKFANGAMTAAFQAAASGMARGSRSGETGQAAKNPLSVLGDIAGKLWTLPNTIIGAVYGSVGHVVGEIGYAFGMYPVSPSIDFGNNAIQFLDNPFTLKDTAITVGNTISYGRGSNPSGFGAYGDSTVEIGRHEQAHTYQYQVLGPLFLPTYFLRGGISGPTGNPFEHAAQEYGSGRGGWWE
ncbi:MAG: hypothetical protein IPG20_20210 [Gammaproteobacteria bacterium]|nr:hypothetical protein [Gammaproteobacteria bacterium]